LQRKVSEIFIGENSVVAANQALIEGEWKHLNNFQLIEIRVRRIKQKIKVAGRDGRRDFQHAMFGCLNKYITNLFGG
jgi:hypothetical protein